jgi:hypothetical protein
MEPGKPASEAASSLSTLSTPTPARDLRSEPGCQASGGPWVTPDVRVAYLAGVLLAAVPVLTYALAQSGLIAGIPISAAHLPLSLGAALVLMGMAAARISGHAWLREGTAAMLLAVALAVGSATVAAGFYDLSSDGQEYHQTAILKLADGWNPNWRTIDEGESVHHRWLNHYPKAAWYVAAATLKAGGAIEPAKLWNFVLAAAAGLLVYSALVGWMARWKAAALGTLAALNAVTVCQLLSFYIDGQVASVWCCVVALTLLWVRTPIWPVALPLMGCMGYLAGLKYTGLLFDAIIAACVLATLLARAQTVLARQWVLLAGAAILSGALIMGFNPYVTNVIRRGNPFYLLIGADSYNYVSNRGPNGCCVPPGFQDIDRFTGLFVSVFSVSENNYGYAPTRRKLPFVVASGELRDFFFPDIRVGGWGPLTGGAMLLAAAGVFLSTRRFLGHHISNYVLLLHLAAIFSIPYPWWARYAPMVGFVPLIVLADAWARPQRRLEKVVSTALVATLALNAGLVAYSNFQQQYGATRVLAQRLRELAHSSTPVLVRINETESMRFRLRASGVNYREVRDLPCAPIKIPFSETQFCPD